MDRFDRYYRDLRWNTHTKIKHIRIWRTKNLITDINNLLYSSKILKIWSLCGGNINITVDKLLFIYATSRLCSSFISRLTLVFGADINHTDAKRALWEARQNERYNTAKELANGGVEIF